MTFLLIGVGFLDIFLGLFVFFKNPKKRINLVFLGMTFCLAIWSFTIMLSWIPESIGNINFWSNSTFWGPSLLVGFLYYFVLIFPKSEKYPTIFQNIMIFFPGVLLIFLSFFNKINKNTVNPWTIERDWGIYIFELYFIILVVISIVILIKKFRKFKGISKNQIKYLFIGILFSAIVGIIFNLVFPLVFNNARLTQIGPPATGFIFILFISFSIIRHRLLDIRIIISRSIIYFFLVLFVAAMFTGVTFLTGYLFEEVLGVSTFLVTLGVSIVIVAFLDPIKRVLSRATDRVFFKAKIEYPQLNRELSEILAKEIEIDNLIEKFTKRLSQGLKIKNSILVLESKDGVFKVRTMGHPHTEPILLDQKNPLIKYLNKNNKIIIAEELNRKIEDTKDEKEKNELQKSYFVIEQIKAAAVAPVKTQERLNAVLVLGPKLSGDVFNREEVNLIQVLSPQIASAIEKSKLYDEVKTFSETLKQKVDDATKELSEKNRFLLSLQKVTNLITRSLDLNKVTQNIVDSISQELGYIGGLLLFLDNKKKVVYPAAITESTLTNKALKLLPKKMQEYSTPIEKDNTLDGQAIKQGEIKFGKSFSEFISPPVPKVACLGIDKLLGVKTIIAVPIYSEDEVIGVIDFVIKKPRNEVSKREIEAMESLADQTGIVARNLRLFEQIQKANEDLEEANKHLKQLDQAKTEFVSITSHQLRTPMTGIKGYLSMLTSGDFGKLKPEHNKLLKQLLDESERMIRLINQFLNVSKIEAGKFELEKKDIQLEELVEKLIKEVEKSAREKNLKLTFQKPKKKLPAIKGDPDKLSDIILNLIDNSIKYTQKGSVSVSVSKQGQNIKFSVKDTGVGIKKEDVKELFGKFQRGTGIARVQPDGSGLGLFIAKSVVEGHQGKIWVESAGEGKGSTFSFTIPIKR